MILKNVNSIVVGILVSFAVVAVAASVAFVAPEIARADCEGAYCSFGVIYDDEPVTTSDNGSFGVIYDDDWNYGGSLESNDDGWNYGGHLDYAEFEPVYYSNNSNYGNYGGYSYQPYSYSYAQPYSYQTPYTYTDYSYDYVYDYEYIHYSDDEDEDEDLWCELDASDTTVEEGDRVTLSWETEGASSASINQGIGSVDEDGGSERVRIDEDTTFRMTVRGNGDTEDCSVTVHVDEENDFSSIRFDDEPTYNPPVVYLSDLPYTGADDVDPTILTYWMLVVSALGGAGYLFFLKGMPILAFANAINRDEEETEAPAEVTPETETADATQVAAFISALEEGNEAKAIGELRDAVATGADIETLLEGAEAVAAGTALESRISAALEASRVNGIRGAKAVLTA